MAVPPLFWSVNCIKIRGNVELLSGPTVHFLYCGSSTDLMHNQPPGTYLELGGGVYSFIIWLRQMTHADWLIRGLERVILPA